MLENQESSVNVENFVPQEIADAPVEDVKPVTIEKGTMPHKLNRRQRNLMNTVSKAAFGSSSRWQKFAHQPKPVGQELDEARTKDPNKPVFRTVCDMYSADEILNYMEKVIVFNNIPTSEKEKLATLSQEASGDARHRNLWESEFFRDQRPAGSSMEILTDIINGLKAMVSNRAFSTLSDKDQIRQIAIAFNSKQTLSLPLSFLITDDNRKELTSILDGWAAEDLSRFMDVTVTEPKQGYFNFNAPDVASEILFLRNYPNEAAPLATETVEG